MVDPSGEDTDGRNASSVKLKLINIRLQDISLKGSLELTPRRYQVELCEKALKGNVIICLGTGLGKTFIVVLYLNSPDIYEQIHTHNRRIVFLAPTQDLVQQQADYINKQVLYRAKVYCGRTCQLGEHIDHWDRPTWDAELEKIQILFMTPQIFASAISTNLLDWSKFAAIIFDECHHGCKSETSKKKESGHPYAQILKSYHAYYSLRRQDHRPSIIGLSASLINTLPKTSVDILSQINRVERLYSATCVTDFEAQEAKPKMVISDYQFIEINEDNDYLIYALTNIQKEIDLILKPNKQMEEKFNVISTMHEAFKKRLKLASMGYAVKLPSIGKIFKGMILIRNALGLWAFRESCQYFLDVIQKPEPRFNLPEKAKAMYEDVSQILKIFHDSVDEYLNQQSLQESLLLSTRNQPKALLSILKKEYERAQINPELTFSCLVFVRSRLEVRALCKWLKAVSETIPEYKFIKCEYTVGLAKVKNTASKLTKTTTIEQARKLNNFREGNLNVIVTTPVLEEGIDLPICSTVIRYTEAKTFREFVQGRGRSRQQLSSYITMCKDGDTFVTKANLYRFNQFEIDLRLALTKYDIGPEERRKYAASKAALRRAENGHDGDKSLYEDDFFLANNNMVRISSSTARVILHMYCQMLSKNRPFSEKVRYGRNQVTSSSYQTTIYLPSSCPISAKGIVGREKTSEELADDSAVVATIKALYDAKELDSKTCTPFRFSERNVDNLLGRHGLEPKYLSLHRSCEGEVRKEGDKEISYYAPKLFEPKYNCLMRNIHQRTYKLIKIRFIAKVGLTRRETQRFFEAPVFGLIVDSTTCDDFIPPELFSHYGQFVIQHEVISDCLKLSTQDHSECFYFTLKILTKCLGIRGLRNEDLRGNCLFYLVILNESNEPNFHRMKKTFYETYRTIQTGDVVKVRAYYLSLRQGSSTDSRTDDRLMVVKAIHTNMNALSMIPQFNRNFKQDAEYKYGQGIITKINQPVVEVVPISKEFAQIREGKLAKKDYTSDSLYYLEQFLEYFHNEPCHIFQAFNLPEVIYRLYLVANSAELDIRFVNETRERRQRVVSPEPEAPQSIELSLAGDQIDICPEGHKGDMIDQPDESPDSDPDYDSDSGSSSDSNSDSDSDSESSDDELLNEEEAKIFVQNVHQKQIEGRNKENIREMTSSYEHNSFRDLALLGEAEVGDRFRRLSQMTEEPLRNLTTKLAEFRREVPVIDCPDSEGALAKRGSGRIDKSIRPPLSLDRGTRPIRQGPSRSLSLLEALTLSRAQGGENLELVENLGDSYLKYVTSMVLYKKLTDVNDGLLSLSRSRLTCNKYFTHLAKRSELGPYAITRGFSTDVLAQTLGRKVRGDFELRKKRSLSKMRPKDLADVFEAIIGSFLVHHGEYEAILAIEWLKLDLFHDQDVFDELHEDAVVFSRVPPPLVQSAGSEDMCRKYKARLEKFETILGYNFNEPSFLIQAFTHPTFSNKCTPSYERLEFVSDAILDHLITQTLIASTPERGHWTPGQITSSRSALVNNSAFARLAIGYGYDLFLLHESQEIYAELARLREYLEADQNMEMPWLDLIEFDSIVKLMGDLFESVAGAIYLDSGCSLDTVWKIYYPMMQPSIQQEIYQPTKNPVALLYETYPGKDRIKFERVEIKQGSETSVVAWNLTISGFNKPFEGCGLTKHQAKMRAVMKAHQVTEEERNKCQEEYRKKNPDVRQRQDRSRRPFVRPAARRFQRHNVPNRRY